MQIVRFNVVLWKGWRFDDEIQHRLETIFGKASRGFLKKEASKAKNTLSLFYLLGTVDFNTLLSADSSFRQKLHQ